MHDKYASRVSKVAVCGDNKEEKRQGEKRERERERETINRRSRPESMSDDALLFFLVF